MKTYYYVHTGHRIGLDRFRRAVALLEQVGGEITLLTSDYRIASEARHFGIENSVGIDVVRNIPHIAHNGDNLIFDSDEANPLMLEDMKQYFSTFIHVPNDTVAVQEKFFAMQDSVKDVKLSYFFGDDDYEKDLEKHFDFVDGLNPHLQLGYYYFLDYEDMLKEKFSNYFEFEAYDEMIQRSEVLLTSSPQAVLDSLAAGGYPIYFKREDYSDDFDELFETLNIKIISNYENNQINEIIQQKKAINYSEFHKKSNKFASFIKESLNL